MTDGPQGMHDVPTHHGVGGVPHVPTHQPPAWYASPHDREPLHRAEAPSSYGAWGATQPPEPPTSRGGRSDLVWVVPVVGIACLIAAFSLVTMLLGRGGPEQSAPTLDQITRSESPSTASSSTSDTSDTSDTVAPSAPSSTSASATQASSVTSSQVSSESASAGASSVSFPAGTGQHCQTYDGATTTLNDADVQQVNGGLTSCDFLVDLRKSVWAHDAAAPGDSSYALDVFSRVRREKVQGSDGMVHLVCSPENGLIHCVSREAEVDAWVRSQRS